MMTVGRWRQTSNAMHSVFSTSIRSALGLIEKKEKSDCFEGHFFRQHTRYIAPLAPLTLSVLHVKRACAKFRISQAYRPRAGYSTVYLSHNAPLDVITAGQRVQQASAQTCTLLVYHLDVVGLIIVAILQGPAHSW
jgi:hypothetical protein